MRPEYDFIDAKRGKHHKPMPKGFSIEIHKADGSTEIRHFLLPEIQLGNYTEERDQLFEGMTLEDMVSEIKKEWKPKQ